MDRTPRSAPTEATLARRSGAGRTSVARAAVAACFAFALGFAPRLASADDSNVARAREAYERGVRAHAGNDFVAAARAFAEADALAPAPASLEAALESAMRADDAVLGVELTERMAGRPSDPSLARTVAAAKKRFGGRTGKIVVHCAGAARCLFSVDGVGIERDVRPGHAPVDADSPHVIVKPGAHAVRVVRGEESREERFEKLVEVAPDVTVTVEGPDVAGPGKKVAPEPRRGVTKPAAGISPVWFFVAGGLTLVAGGVTTWSALDVANKNDTFAADGCGPSGTGPLPSDCPGRADDGRSAQVRTNILLGVTAALAVTTAVTGIFFVRWSSAPSGAGGVATLGTRF